MNVFITGVMAILTGDTDTQTAVKIQRQAVSALKVQISNMDANTINKEDAVTEAKANLEKAFVNNGKVMDGESGRATYVANLLSAKNAVTEAQEALDIHNETIAFLKERLELAQKEGVVEEAREAAKDAGKNGQAK